jgi:hypothetical protein
MSTNAETTPNLIPPVPIDKPTSKTIIEVKEADAETMELHTKLKEFGNLCERFTSLNAEFPQWKEPIIKMKQAFGVKMGHRGRILVIGSGRYFWKEYCTTFFKVSSIRVNQLLNIKDDKGTGVPPEKGKGKGKTIDMQAAKNAFYADRYRNGVIGLVNNAPPDADSDQIIETLQKEAQDAYRELGETEAKAIKIPELVPPNPAKKKLEAEVKTLKESEATLLERLNSLQELTETDYDENITQALEAEPDIREAAKLLAAAFTKYAERLMPPSMSLVGNISNPTLKLVGRAGIICTGDYLCKHLGKANKDQLAQCVGIQETNQRARIKEWVDGTWTKDHVLYESSLREYRVITLARAHKIGPDEAFEPKTREEL